MFTHMTTTESVTRLAAQNVINALNEYLRITNGTPLMIVERGTSNYIIVDDFSIMKLNDTGDITIY